jgi:serine carboxypeptidase-like clade 1
MSAFATALLLSAFALLTEAAVPADEVLSLPGWKGKLPTRQYSGYVEIDEKTGKSLHYWFVESETDPATAPVVLWLNGGPGCSSLEGYLAEQGPLHISDNWENETIPSLYANPYAWNRVANMLFLEAPAGVGFSYSNSKEDYHTNDNITADDNFEFLKKWFELYSEYAKNDFYITGESYAGIYVPTLAWNIHTKPNTLNLKGFMVGNGCTGSKVGVCSFERYKYMIEFFYGHGLYSDELHSKLEQTCMKGSEPSRECLEYYDEMLHTIGDINIYDIYQPCINSGVKSEPVWKAKTAGMESLTQVGAECIDGGAAAKYLDLPEVREAIHVKSEAEVGPWHVCSSKLHYESTVDSLLPAYPTLIKNYRVVIYNGDVDACVPYIDNEQWTSGLGIPVLDKWRAWYVDSQVAGYVTTYNLNSFAFITVKGSGHMVSFILVTFC